MHLFQVRSNLGLISSTEENAGLHAVWREGGNLPAVCNRCDTTKASWKSGWEETTSFLLGRSRSRWNSFFHLPSYFYVPLWRRPQSAEQMWMRLWWKGNSNRVNPYSFTHRDHPLLVPGSVGRESDLWHSSEAFLLLLFLLLLTCFSSLARSLNLTDKDLRRRLTWEILSLAMGTFAWIAKAPHQEQEEKVSQFLHAPW